MYDEDADIREHLAALGPGAVDELKRILEQKESTYRGAALRALAGRPANADLATLMAMADTPTRSCGCGCSERSATSASRTFTPQQ